MPSYTPDVFTDVPDPRHPPPGAIPADATALNKMGNGIAAAQAAADAAAAAIMPAAYIDPRKLGAKFDGSTDDTAAWLAAFAAATPSSYGSNYEVGTSRVIHPGGVSLISSLLQVPNHVDLVGMGQRLAAFKCTASGAGVQWGIPSPFSGTGYRGGHNGHFIIDGNGIATNPWRIGKCTQMTFSNIECRGSAGDALSLSVGQNHLFTSIVIGNNAGCGIVFDGGAGGHAFVKCELTTNGSLGGSGRTGSYNVKSWETFDTTGVIGYNEPSDNHFYGCVIERPAAAGAAGNMYLGAAFNWTFTDCNFPYGRLNGSDGQRSVITARVDGVNGSSRTSAIRFHNTMSQGTKSGASIGSVWLDAAGAVELWFSGHNVPTLHDVIWMIDDNAQVFTDGMTAPSPATYDALFQNQAGGTKTFEQAVRSTRRAPMLTGAVNDTNYRNQMLRDPADGDWAELLGDTTHMYFRLGGAWKSTVVS